MSGKRNLRTLFAVLASLLFGILVANACGRGGPHDGAVALCGLVIGSAITMAFTEDVPSQPNFGRRSANP